MKKFILQSRTGVFFDQREKVSLQTPDSIYFMGVCGTAMASLAIYLKQEGFHVFGSDQKIYPPMSSALKQADIPVFPYNEQNIQTHIKLIIVGNVISRNHKEIQRVQQLGIPCLSLPEFLEQTLLSQTKNIVVAGTHGKSTGTSLLSHLGEQTGQNPGFFVGAVPKNFPVSFRSTNSSYFVIEGDEYDTCFFAKKPKFFYYKPFAVLLTGIEFDHGDIYHNLKEITDLFCEFIQKIPSEGCLVACLPNKEMEKLIPYSKAPVFTYGLRHGDYQIQNRSFQKDQQTFDICYKDQVYTCSLPLLGEHNALNALGAFALAHRLGWPAQKILPALKSFQGLKRRMELKGFLKKGKVYEDFAHHPRAVQSCLSALKEKYPDKKIIALFEPSSFTSLTNIFQKEYIQAFQNADLIFLPRERNNDKIPKDQRFSSEKLVQDLKQQGKQAFCHDRFEDIQKALVEEMDSRGVAVFMSSGAFGGLLNSLPWDE